MEIEKHLQNLNLEPQKQELTGPKGGDKSFEVAIRGTHITNESIEQIKKVLRLVMVKIGLRAANWPTDEEKLILIEHIITNYGGHTTKEILLAFDMGIAGKLDFEEKESIQCYENFSCLYFSSVMNAYRRWAKDQHKQIKPKMIETEGEKLTDETMKDWYEETKNQVKNRKCTVEFIPLQLYDWAVNNSMIFADNKTKWSYLGMAIEHREAKLYADVSMDETAENKRLFKDFMEMKKAGCFEGEEKTILINLARKMILFDAFLKENPF